MVQIRDIVTNGITQFECRCKSCGRNNGVYRTQPTLQVCRYCHQPAVRIVKVRIRRWIRPDPYTDANPSQVTKVYWISAVRRNGSPYPVPSFKSGKWLIFVPNEQVDAVWSKIKKATEEGLLGDSSKVATSKPNPNAVSADKKVICVYSYDWTDYDDVMRIRAELRNLGINWKISYKSDADTASDKYSVKGDRNIAKYYI